MKGSKRYGFLNSLFDSFSDKRRLCQELSSVHHSVAHSCDVLTTTHPYTKKLQYLLKALLMVPDVGTLQCTKSKQT